MHYTNLYIRTIKHNQANNLQVSEDKIAHKTAALLDKPKPSLKKLKDFQRVTLHINNSRLTQKSINQKSRRLNTINEGSHHYMLSQAPQTNYFLISSKQI
jgi:ribosomal protein L44E